MSSTLIELSPDTSIVSDIAAITDTSAGSWMLIAGTNGSHETYCRKSDPNATGTVFFYDVDNEGGTLSRAEGIEGERTAIGSWSWLTMGALAE